MILKIASLLNSSFIMPCETQHAFTCHNKVSYVT